TELIITKADVLTDFDTIKVCTHYKLNGKEINYLPYEINEPLEPVYKEFKGWKEDISKIDIYDQLPTEFKDYLNYIENEVKVSIKIVSVGPNRKQTISR
ncbi:MAG: adenylosuccinate synthetase, partial [Bacteroidales bacterium]|nr:adenylosuccinate synthetase [Bacteroidales bacterium]